MRLPVPLVTALAALLLPCGAGAWSEPGHRIVGELAEQRMGPAARRLVREQIGTLSLADRGIAMWADEVRDRRTGPWHYVNLPAAAARYEARRDCPPAGCAVSALENAIAALRRESDPGRLVEALRWIVHLTADLHQPMHAGEARDRGGNETALRLGKRRQPLNLHRLWDAELVDPILRGSDPLRVGRSLAATLRPTDAAAWSAELSPAAWATESHLVARAVYAELGSYPLDGDTILLPAGYPASQRSRVEEALSKAGVRLAALLDRIAAEREARRPSGSSPLPR